MTAKLIIALTLVCLALMPAQAQSAALDELIARYEVFTAERDVDVAARAADIAPDRWGDVSPDFIAWRAEKAATLLAAVRALPEDQAGPETSILKHLLQSDIDAHRFDTARIPMTGDWGFFAEPFFAAGRTQIQSEADARAWIARLNDIERYFNQNIDNMRRGLATGWVAYADPIDTGLRQIQQQTGETLTSSILYTPLTNLPASWDEDLIAQVQADGEAAITRALAATRDLQTFLETEYAPNARRGAGLATLENGQAAYASAVAYHTAGAGYSPEEIHALGLSEVARIRADMESIIAEVEFEGSFEDFVDFLRTDPQFYAQSPAELLEKASEMSKRLDAILPRYFGTLPRLPYGVAPVPANIAPGFTTGRYVSGNQEDGRAGAYWVNTYALDQRPLYELPALSAHEAVPGHHLQIALAQELENVPEFRRTYYATAFGEGWGLYAEKLAGEAGFYRTPYERFGQLSYEMWRACRLVSDTGLHWYGWSRKEAAACFEDNTALAPLNIETEVTRYIGWPGQATAYKVGELKILQLRARAKETLGEAFDIRAFHDHLLGAGAMPLDALEARMDAWLEDQTGS